MAGNQTIGYLIRVIFNLALKRQINIQNPSTVNTSHMIMVVGPAINLFWPSSYKIQLEDMSVPGEYIQVAVNSPQTHPW